MYLVSKNNYVNSIRAKATFCETLRNAWNLNIKSGLIQNLSGLSHYTKAYNLRHWEHNIPNTKFFHLRYQKLSQIDLIQEKITNKGRYFYGI